MNSQDFYGLQEAYQTIQEGFVNPYKAPHAHGRSMSGDKEKGETLGNMARLSPAMKATQKSYQLQASEPKSRREKAQTRAARHLQQMRQAAKVTESFDVYDLILSHLLDEGFCDDVDAANVIMAHMSEEWRNEILEASDLTWLENLHKLAKQTGSKDPHVRRAAWEGLRKHDQETMKPENYAKVYGTPRKKVKHNVDVR